MDGEPICGHDDCVRCISVDENGGMIVSGSYDKTLIRWDARTGKQIGKPMCGHSREISFVAISSCGKMILSGSRDGTLQIWDAVNGNPMGEPFRGHSSWVQSVAFREERGIIVSGSGDGTIRQWRTDPCTRISESTQKCDGEAERIIFSDGRQKLVTISDNGTLLQWEVTNGKPIGKPMKGWLNRALCIAVNEQCGMIVAVLENEVIRWNTRTCEMMGKSLLLKHESYLNCAALSSNGETIVTGSSDGTVRRWCTRSGDTISEPMRGHKEWVTFVAFSANDEMIVSGSHDGSIIRWSTPNGQKIGEPLIHNDWIYRSPISADGKVIVSSSTDGGLCRLDLSNGQLLGKSVSKGWCGHIISTNTDCTQLVTWNFDKTIRCWRVGPGGTIHKTSALLASADITVCAIDMNHGVAAVGSGNGAVGVCDIHKQVDSVGAV